MPKKRPPPGSVCQFDLGDGRFAYGRLLRDASIAIYSTVTPTSDRPPVGERAFRFTVGTYQDIPGSRACPVVGVDPFESDVAAWPPPMKIVDPITGKVRVYDQGEIIPAQDPAEAMKLETAAAWDLNHVLDRIRGSLPE